MDYEIILTALVFLLIVAAVFILLGRSSRKQEKHLRQMLKQKAAAAQSVITEYDTWHNTAIGIDQTTNNLFAVYVVNRQPLSVHIALAEIKDCLVKRTNRPIVTGNETYAAIEKIWLEFVPSKKLQAGTVVPFFDAGNDSLHLNGELEMVNKWHALVHNSIQALQLKS